MLVTYFPGQFGGFIRSQYYRRKFKRCGKNLIVEVGTIINGAELISVGDNVHIDKYCIISTGLKLVGSVTHKPNTDFDYAKGELIIGSNVHIVQFCIIMAYGGISIADSCLLSAGVKIYSHTNIPNDFEDKGKIITQLPYKDAPFLLSPVVLKNNVWVGLNSIIMPGVSIDRNSFVVSNSLVMGKFPENSYIQGQPATRTRERFIGALN